MWTNRNSWDKWSNIHIWTKINSEDKFKRQIQATNSSDKSKRQIQYKTNEDDMDWFCEKPILYIYVHEMINDSREVVVKDVNCTTGRNLLYHHCHLGSSGVYASQHPLPSYEHPPRNKRIEKERETETDRREKKYLRERSYSIKVST